MSTDRELLELAAKALERADKISGHSNNRKTITALRAALAEPVQEPVAWAYQWKQGKNRSWYVTVARWHESDMWHEYPLYTVPQQEVREHLSDEQIEDLLGIGNPTAEEKHLIRMGFNAARKKGKS